jgi:phosphatidate cytidylyltransferase
VTRIVTGLLLAAAVVFIMLRTPPVVIWCALVLVAMLAVDEVRRILGRLGRAPWPAVTFAGTLGVVLAFLKPSPALIPALTALLLVTLLRALWPTQSPAEGMDRALGTIFAVLYVGMTLGHIGGMFPLGQDAAGRERAGAFVLLLFACVYVGDTWALYGGKNFGRHKLAPGVSPSKTWEGAVFGMAGSVVSALVVRALLLPDLTVLHVMGLGIVLGVTGILGDLTESLLKRAAAVKDSGTLLPGHGGMLDRVDSLLLAAPVLYWYQRLL